MTHGLNQTSVYEPIPLWGCQHNWIMIDSPIKTWASTETRSEPPENAPVMQKRKCLNCGGFELIGVKL